MDPLEKIVEERRRKMVEELEAQLSSLGEAPRYLSRGLAQRVVEAADAVLLRLRCGYLYTGAPAPQAGCECKVCEGARALASVLEEVEGELAKGQRE